MSLIYQAFNVDVAALIPDNAKRILDVGCGNGTLGAWIKSKQSVEVDGVTFSEAEAVQAVQVLDHVFVGDINIFDFAKTGGQYDCIICSHVLEHLYEPWDVVVRLQELLKLGGTLIIAIPNILFFKQRMQFVLGRFRYNKAGGLMDQTHFRFFDWKSVEQLVEKSSLILASKSATGMFPQPIIRKILPSISKRIDALMLRNFPGLFGFQFLLVLKKEHSS